MEYNLEVFIHSMLDIGANAGHFSDQFRDRYQTKDIVCIEPNPNLTPALQAKGYEVHAVGASSKTSNAIFHINNANKVSTGNSFFLEQTVHFQSVEEVEVPIVRLDDLFPERTFDFIKVDTQGSEFDIVDGGRELIKRSKYLLIEVPFFPFNKGARLAHEVIPLISSLGLIPVSFPEYHFGKREHFNNMFNESFNDSFITHMDILWKNF